MKTVYSLEDDVILSEVIGEFLQNAGFHIKTFSDYRLFFDAIRANKPDIILLDLMLPMISGFEILKYLKANLVMHNIPVIVVSGINNEKEKVECLDLGADDYISKPFGFNELASRIKAVLRRFGMIEELNFENLTINQEKRTVKINDELVELTKKEYEVLLYFVSHVDKIITKEELLNKFWEGINDHSRTIDMHIKALRQKVFNYTNLELITILKVGYKLSKK